MSGPLLRAAGVSHSFGSTPVLRDVTVEVHAGQIVAVMGPSGSGKSTLLHIMAGLLRPDQGTVEFLGHRVDRLSERARSELRLRSIGLVFQFGDLVPELTVQENIELPMRLTKVARDEARRRSAELLDRFGIGEVADHLLSQVSGGQAQRAAVARALATRSPLLLADEPTGSLDTITGELVLESMVEAARDQDTAIVVVTHELRVAGYAERAIVIRDGRIVADDADAPGAVGARSAGASSGRG